MLLIREVEGQGDTCRGRLGVRRCGCLSVSRDNAKESHLWRNHDFDLGGLGEAINAVSQSCMEVKEGNCCPGFGVPGLRASSRLRGVC